MSRFLKTDIDAAIDCLKKGGIILYPTDTVWGIGCDAANENAVRRIFELKRRAEAKSMISLVADSAQLERFTDGLPEIAFQLIEEAVTPLTIIVDHPVGIAPSMLAPDGSAGFRVSDEPFNRELCRRLRRPLVSTSANISGQPTPRFFGEIPKEIIDAVDYVAIYRRDDTEPRRPSAIIKISGDASFKIIRK